MTSSQLVIDLPEALLERLHKAIPQHERNAFIVKAIHERLELVEQAIALEESAGSWTLENHPDMKDGAAIDAWLKRLRKGR